MDYVLRASRAAEGIGAQWCLNASEPLSVDPRLQDLGLKKPPTEVSAKVTQKRGQSYASHEDENPSCS